MYANYDYNRFDVTGVPNLNVHSLSVAARLAVLDTTGVSARGEWVRAELAGTKADQWAITGTIDHALTDNLTLNNEVRYDGVDSTTAAGGGGLLNSSGTTFNSEGGVVYLMQLVYEF
jgi:hypothetical protein